MQLGFGIDEYQALTYLGNTTNEHTTIVRAPIAHDLIATLALQVSRSEPARECFGKDVHLLLACAKLGSIRRNNRVNAVTGNSRFNAVDHRTVHPYYSLHVFRRFHATFDFERSHTRLQELGNEVCRAQVFRRKQMLAWSIEGFAQGAIVQLVWQTARLGTTAAIGGTTAHQRRHEALARIANA